LRSVSPSADALLALARAGDDAWPALRSDPGAILLLVRHSAALDTPSPSFSLSSLQDAALLEAALEGLRDGRGSASVNWGSEAVRPIYAAAVDYARLAARLAEATGQCHPALAWVSGLLAPLGWLAVCAIDPGAASACITSPDHVRRPGDVERRLWGLDGAALARRLARRWQLPDWLTATVGHLGLPADVAERFGAVPALFRVVQLAVLLAQRDGGRLRLEVGVSLTEALAAVNLSSAAAEDQVSAAALEAVPPPACRPPSEVPLLGEVLRLAAENRRLREGPGLHRMEQELDGLHAALREARAGEAQRLQAQKLAALAEFAAGAGHEINNPLAVISGQAQFLLNNRLRGQREPARMAPTTPSRRRRTLR
jgi:signal transduction histidine kinase